MGLGGITREKMGWWAKNGDFEGKGGAKSRLGQNCAKPQIGRFWLSYFAQNAVEAQTFKNALNGNETPYRRKLRIAKSTAAFPFGGRKSEIETVTTSENVKRILKNRSKRTKQPPRFGRFFRPGWFRIAAPSGRRLLRPGKVLIPVRVDANAGDRFRISKIVDVNDRPGNEPNHRPVILLCLNDLSESFRRRPTPVRRWLGRSCFSLNPSVPRAPYVYRAIHSFNLKKAVQVIWQMQFRPCFFCPTQKK